MSASPPRLPEPDEIAAEQLRRSMRRLVADAWPLVERRKFVSGWHVDAICEHLEAVSAGELRRLIVNIPPRHMKSLAVAVFWPVWDWLTRPDRQWLFSSYAEKLSKRDSLKCRRIIEHPGGRREGGTLLERVGYRGVVNLLGADWHLTGDQNEKLRFDNSETGYRLATSVGGTATGDGGDILVLDDPHKADEAESSQTQRENVVDWIDGTLSTRLNDPDTGAVVVVMQRLHENDATGHLLEQGGFTHLCLPAEYEPSHPFVWPEDPRTEPGELLWPERFGAEAVEELKVRLGSFRAAGQLQQHPTPLEGGILQRSRWQSYSEPPQMQKVVESWDMAFKDTDGSDYVVGQVWGRDFANRYLLGEIRARLDFPATKAAVRALAAWTEERWPSESGTRLVEDKANGPAVIAELRDEVSGLIAVEPKGSKEARAHAVAPAIEAGNVYLPEREIPCPVSVLEVGNRSITLVPDTREAFIEECAGFPNGANDDRVDAMTQALARLKGGGKVRRPRTV